MDDKEARRRKAREEAPCLFPEKNPTPDSLPKGRPSPACDIPSVPFAEPFAAPEPCPETPAVSVVMPDPLVVSSAQAVASCPAAAPKNGPTGDNVTILAGAYTESFFFARIEDISPSQLSFIATLGAPDRAELVGPTTTPLRIVELTGLSIPQATQLKNEVAALQALVDAYAAEAAYNLLQCRWLNVEQSASCPLGALLTGDISIPADKVSQVANPSIVAAGTFSSVNSQLEANQLALAEAEANLRCLYTNTERTRSCLDIGFTEDITDVDNTPDTLDGRLRKGYVTIPAYTVFSPDSVSDANIAADALADGQLSCFYPNPEVVVTCAGQGLPAGTPGVSGPPVGDALTGTRGQSITVPTGFLVSSISTLDAQNQATSYALSLLECWICNVEVTEICENQPYVDRDGVTQSRAPSPDSSPSSVTVSACTIKSEIGQQDADDRATALALAQLGCIYCNPVIPPTCVPPGFETPPVPLESYVRGTWSRDATQGQAADTYCCQGVNAAQNCYEIADNVAAVPIDDKVNDVDCRYGNDPASFDCGGDVFSGDPPVLTEMKGGGSAYVPANVFFVGASAGGKAQADQIAQDFAESSVLCYWDNFQQTGECPPGTESPLVATVGARAVQSFSSQQNANDMAKALATSLSLCSPQNTTGNSGGQTCECSCPEDQEILLCPTIPANTVRASTEAEANALAENLACSLVVCGGAGEKGDDGLPGNDGAQTGCAGTCYGYYS